MLIFNKNSFKGRSEVHTAYKEYCDYYGLENENEKALVSRLRNTAKISEGKRSVGGKRERCWIGIDLKKLPEDEENGAGGTGGTASMDNYTSTNLETSLKLKESSRSVPNVPSVPNNEEKQSYFAQCYFCGQPIYEPDVVTNQFTEDKPAHRSCYDRKFGELKKHDRGRGLND